jgi:hypothetical protein
MENKRYILRSCSRNILVEHSPIDTLKIGQIAVLECFGGRNSNFKLAGQIKQWRTGTTISYTLAGKSGLG